MFSRLAAFRRMSMPTSTSAVRWSSTATAVPNPASTVSPDMPTTQQSVRQAVTPQTKESTAPATTSTKKVAKEQDFMSNIMADLQSAHDKQVQELNARREPLPDVLNATSTSSNTQGWTQIFKQLNVKRFFRFEQAFMATNPETDLILSSEEASRTYMFNVFDATHPENVAAAICAIPPNLRRLHAVFGVEGFACDFFADVDLPKDANVDPETFLKVTLDITLKGVQKIGLKNPDVMILKSPNDVKHSFHIHIRSPTACLKDFTHVRSLAYQVNDLALAKFKELKIDHQEAPFDTAIYRKCGQMRMAHCSKYGKGDNFLTMYTPKDAALKQLVSGTVNFTMAEQVLMSACMRPRDPTVKVVKAKQNSFEVEKDGTRVKKEMMDENKEKRFNDCINQLRKMPSEFAREYRTWNNVGCALFSFGPEFEERALDAWLTFSRTAGTNFDPNACKKRFRHSYRGGTRGTSVERNWRRGYTYIMFTIWGKSPKASAKKNKAVVASIRKK